MSAPAWSDDVLRDVHRRHEARESWASIAADIGDDPTLARLRYSKASTGGRLARVLGGGHRSAPTPVAAGSGLPGRPGDAGSKRRHLSVSADELALPGVVAAPSIDRVAPTVHRWHVPAERTPNWEHWTLLLSDLHYDNPLCRRDLLRWYLDQARARRAGVCVIGDFHCGMEGKYDPRHAKGNVRPEYMRDDYLWALVEYGAALIAEYPDLAWLLTDGNHETSILKRLEYDLTAMTAKEAMARRGPGAPAVSTGGYAGWIIWQIAEPGGYRQERVTHYDHGSGMGGPVTKGVIGTNRRAVYTPDAHEVWTGHIHEAWYLEVTRERASMTGTTLDVQQHVCLGTLKEERLAGRGFHVERGRPPKPLGGWWRRLYWSHLDPPGYRVQYIRTEW